MAGRAARRQPQPGHPLLRGLQQVEALAREGQAEAADLADRLGDPLEQLRVLVHQEARAPGAAGLLIRGKGEHDVAGRLALLAQALADDRQHHRVHVLHVDRAAAPDAVVGDLAGEGVDLPVFGVGRDDVEMTVDEQSGPVPVFAFEACDHAGALGMRLQDRGLQAGLGEPGGYVFGGLPLARARMVPWVRGVDPDQVAADVDDLILRGHGVSCHRSIVALRRPGPGWGCGLGVRAGCGVLGAACWGRSGAPSAPERHETPDPARSDAVESRFHDVWPRERSP